MFHFYCIIDVWYVFHCFVAGCVSWAYYLYMMVEASMEQGPDGSGKKRLKHSFHLPCRGVAPTGTLVGRLVPT
jgi:hypothetical protein